MTVQEPNQVGGKTQVEPENPCVTGPYPARPYGSSTKPAAAASSISPYTASSGKGARPHRLGGLRHPRKGRGVPVRRRRQARLDIAAHPGPQSGGGGPDGALA